MGGKDLQWHPGVYAAFGVETKGTGYSLQNEYPLGTKPVMIDILARKTGESGCFTKNIVKIFRRHNIIEYKGPDESISTNDYYKVLSYAARYIADTEHVLEITPAEITMTFICNHYPRKLIGHLQDAYEAGIERIEKGIYYLSGTIFMTQIIICRELDPKKNLWLYSMRKNLTDEEIEAVTEDYEKHKNEKNYQSAMDLIVRANWEKVKERMGMCEALRELVWEVYGKEIEEKAEARAEVIAEARAEVMAEARAEAIAEAKAEVIAEAKVRKIVEKRAEARVEEKIISLINKKLLKGKTEEVIAEELEEEVPVIHALITRMMQASN